VFAGSTALPTRPVPTVAGFVNTSIQLFPEGSIAARGVSSRAEVGRSLLHTRVAGGVVEEAGSVE
jgi:hypothetical protein